MTSEQVRSVLSILETACAAEGVTPDEARSCRISKGKYGRVRAQSRIFARVVARCMAVDRPPSTLQLGRVLGCHHATVLAASKRGRASIDAGEVVQWRRAPAEERVAVPMFDDGND